MAQTYLFHPRTLSKALQTATILKDGKIPPKPLKILQGWQHVIQDQSINKQSESNLHADFYSNLCEGVLGYTGFTRKNKKTGLWTLANESAVKGIGRVDIGFGQFNDQDKQLLAPLELKSPKTHNMDVPMLGRKLSTVQQAAQYARNSEGQAKWFIISNCIEIRLYKYPFSDSVYQCWKIAELTIPENYASFVLLLGAKYLLDGKTERLFNNSQQVEKDITNDLYRDYRDTRIKLINGMKKENNRIRRADMVSRAQTLLDRVLFIAFAEDRGLLPEKTLHNYISNANEFTNAWVMLKLLFTHIDKGEASKDIPKYNGDLFKADPTLEELSLSNELINEFKCLWEYDFNTDVSVTILGHIFEQSITDLDQIYETVNEDTDLQLKQQQQGTTGKRKQDGVVYTPDFITQWIVEKTLGGYLQKKQKEIKHPQDSSAWWLEYRNTLATTRILDPACGSGAFLVAAFNYLKKEYQLLNERLTDLGETGGLFGLDLNTDILNNNLFGVDINAESVEIARLSLWLVTAEKGKPLTSLKENIRRGNSIVAHKVVDKNAFTWHGRFQDFDVILGNPPYVRQERLTPIKPYLEKHYRTYHGVADLYTYFFELGLNLLKKGGYMGYISSATFFKTGSGEMLRQHLQLESNLKTVVNFGDLQVFEGVTTYPAILIMEKPSRTRTQVPAKAVFNFLNVASAKVSELTQELKEAPFGEMKQANLGLTGWNLEDDNVRKLRDKISQDKRTLEEIYGSPSYGIKTGFNTAFVIDKITRNRLIAEDPKSLEIIKPFLEGKDLKKWRAESRNLYLIFTRRGVKIDEYPAIKNYLEGYRARLEPKPKDFNGAKWGGRKAGSYKWYEIQDSVDYHHHFEEPKITYGHFSPTPLFFFDQKAYYSNDKSYIIPNADQYLLGLLNSTTFWLLITSMCPSVRGGFYEVRTYYVDTLPIPEATPEQKKAIGQYAEKCQTIAESRYELENTLRKQIASYCPDDQEAKLSNKLKSGWMLEYIALKKEIKSRFKYALTIKESQELEELFDETKEQIQQLSYQLSVEESALNKAVYELFSLNDHDITLLESSINSKH